MSPLTANTGRSSQDHNEAIGSVFARLPVGRESALRLAARVHAGRDLWSFNNQNWMVAVTEPMESSGRRKVLAAFALVAVVVSGCAGIYREPGVEALQTGEYAIIERGSNDSEIRVVSIDGEVLQNPNLQRLEVRPGTRRMKVQLVRSFEAPKPTSPTSFIEIHFVAGKTYILTYATRSLGPGKGGIFRIWAMDKETGLTASYDVDEAGRRL